MTFADLRPLQLVAFRWRQRIIYGQSLAWDRNLDHDALIVSSAGYPMTHRRQADHCQNPGGDLFAAHLAGEVGRATDRRKRHMDVERAIWAFRHHVPVDEVIDKRGRRHQASCRCAGCRFRDFGWRDVEGKTVMPTLGRGRLEREDIPERLARGGGSEWSYPFEVYLVHTMTRHMEAQFRDALVTLPPREREAYQRVFLGGWPWTGPDGQVLHCPMRPSRLADEWGVGRSTISMAVRSAHARLVHALGWDPRDFLVPEQAA